MDIVLVRHVRASGNERRAYCGRGSDSPVSESGYRQLAVLSEKMRAYDPELVFTSPMQRAKVTAASFFDLPVAMEELSEIDFGIFEGKTLKEIEKEHPEDCRRMLEEGDRFIYPQGEGMEDFFSRVERGLQKLLHLGRGCQRIAVVAHGGTIRAILSLLLAGDSSLYWNFRIENASMTKLSLVDGFAVIETLNDRIAD
ncbi:MAG: histidine phosphatase family protein [Peptostreptococcaceae bacterium]|nr:histidine phosphatase family protein [Peptostreptococcaceae bacterium]